MYNAIHLLKILFVPFLTATVHAFLNHMAIEDSVLLKRWLVIVSVNRYCYNGFSSFKLCSHPLFALGIYSESIDKDKRGALILVIEEYYNTYLFRTHFHVRHFSKIPAYFLTKKI